MATQTNYPTTMAAGYPGQVVNTELNNIISRTVVDASIAFGLAVVAGTADGTVKVGAGTFKGVAVRDRAVEGTSPDAYPVNATAGIMTKGVIYVTAKEAVAAEDTAGFDETGALVKAATGTAIPNAVFDNSGAAGALVKLRLG